MHSVIYRIGGIVQGVGFRPYVYTLAESFALKGYVRNNGSGVTVHVEGEKNAISAFETALPASPPPLARIDTIIRDEMDFLGFEGFEIIKSETGSLKNSAVSPDMAVCDNCLAEMRDPDNRRHGYWLINCTDCGPRYSITRTLPYDRPNTSMEAFEMCPECEKEYTDPTDRRYHAQPIGCHACGPLLSYEDEVGKQQAENALNAAVAALLAGKIVAVKGLGGFHLMCDATNEEAVVELRRRKRRPAKPFAVMFPTPDAVRSVAELSNAEAALMDSKEKPVVLVRRSRDTLSAAVAPGIDRIGVFLPYTPLHHRLFEAIRFPLVATSANLSDEPIIRTEAQMREKLDDVYDGLLYHDREIVNACDDTVMQVVGDTPLMLRLARGFAPLTLKLFFTASEQLLAVGAQQKNALALAFDDKIVAGPHIGDLSSLEAFEYFERTLETFKGFYDFEPDRIVCDLHPRYDTTQWTLSHNRPATQVQHHHAHLLAVMAEHALTGPALGFAFDGTGYGEDGTIWGGEVLLADVKGYARRYHFKPFGLIGGESAVREPRRAALGLLFEHYDFDTVQHMDLPTVNAFSEAELQLLHKAWQKGINTPQTSSVGRLFDAVASLCGIVQQVSYEGESGLLMEGVATQERAEPFAFHLEEDIIDTAPMLHSIVHEALDAAEIASRFIATLTEIIVTIAKAHDEPALFCGGVFQNRVLLETLIERFEEENLRYYLPSKFPVNDASVAMGQLWFALHSGREPETE